MLFLRSVWTKFQPSNFFVVGRGNEAEFIFSFPGPPSSLFASGSRLSLVQRLLLSQSSSTDDPFSVSVSTCASLIVSLFGSSKLSFFHWLFCAYPSCLSLALVKRFIPAPRASLCLSVGLHYDVVVKNIYSRVLNHLKRRFPLSSGGIVIVQFFLLWFAAVAALPVLHWCFHGDRALFGAVPLGIWFSQEVKFLCLTEFIGNL